MTPQEYRDHTAPSGLLHPCIYTVHHAHILLVYSITPHSTPASHSTPLHTPPLYSLIHVDPRWPGAASTLSAARLHAVVVCWARPSPPMLCAGAVCWWCDFRRRHHHIERLHLQRKHRGTQSIERFERSRRAGQMLFHRKFVLLPGPI